MEILKGTARRVLYIYMYRYIILVFMQFLPLLRPLINVDTYMYRLALCFWGNPWFWPYDVVDLSVCLGYIMSDLVFV